MNYPKIGSKKPKREREKLIKACQVCNKSYSKKQETSNKVWSKSSFCSLKCFGQYLSKHPNRKGLKALKQFQFKKGHIGVWTGKKFSQTHRDNLSKSRSLEKSWHWKGGRFKKNGYWMVLNHNHPFAKVSGYILEHRLIMEKKLGRYLTNIEVVHHIDRDRSNNNTNNLQLMSQYEHAKLHKKEKWVKTKCWAKNEKECGWVGKWADK